MGECVCVCVSECVSLWAGVCLGVWVCMDVWCVCVCARAGGLVVGCVSESACLSVCVCVCG